ncbi:MAG: V-type ATP synthase subunit F [Candidatus Muiribacteriota bacterium]|jgi:V/A-type H+-transporting ATPase subunit F
MYKVGIIGNREIISLFRLFDFDCFYVEETEKARQLLSDFRKNNEYAVIFVTENYAKEMLEVIEEFSTQVLPSVIILPTNIASSGINNERLRNIAIKAVGADVFSEK